MKNKTKNLLCSLFGHKLGNWEYAADNSCEQIRTCVRDGYKEHRSIPHIFGEWEYVADNSCEQVRTCLRDGFEEHRSVQHDFGEWEYVADNSCEQVRTCLRDGYKEQRSEPHKFGDWVYVAYKPCEHTRYCIRCGEKDTRENHFWGPWTPDGDYHVRSCEKDGAKEIEPHDWTCTGSSDEYEGSKYQGGLEFDVYSTTSYYTCNKCGATKTEGGTGATARGIC